MLSKFLIGSLILISFASYSQENYLRVDKIEGATMMSPFIQNPDQKIEGDAYLHNEWKEIKIERVDGKKLLAPKAKYHIEQEELIVEVEDVLYRINNKTQIRHFQIDDQTFRALFYEQDNFGFFQELVVTSKIILLKKHICNVIKGQDTNGIMAATSDKYSQHKTEYYVQKVVENSEPLLLKVSSKKISIKSDQYPELSEFLDGIKGKFKSDASLVQVFQDF